MSADNSYDKYDVSALAAQFSDAANSIEEMAEIRFAELKSNVRRHGKWDEDERIRIISDIDRLGLQARFCRVMANIIGRDEDRLYQKSMAELPSVGGTLDCSLDAWKIHKENMCSRSGRLIHYEKGQWLYRDDHQPVPPSDRSRSGVVAS